MPCLFDDPGKPALFLGGGGEMGQGDLEKWGEGQMGRVEGRESAMKMCCMEEE